MNRTMKHILLVCLLFWIAGCSEQQPRVISDADVATSWARLSLYLMKYTPSNSPTYASRTAGYIGLTMYESVVEGFDTHQSLRDQLNNLDGMPTVDGEICWPLALNAGQAVILKEVYRQTSDENKLKIDSLEQYVLSQYQSSVNSVVTDRSIAYGRAVAMSIAEWAKEDGGHRGYLKNFDKSFKGVVRPGSWKPPLYAQSFSHHPLHPYWGQNRTFLKENANLPLPDFIPYDTTEHSPYYQQFMEVYQQDLNLTQVEKEIAIWWGDDPDETFTPPGHSFYLATMALEQSDSDLITSAETYARVGMAVADAFINCWKWKFHFFTERPNTFIPTYIDQEWESFWPDPPFPSFPSGHAIQAAAMATVLENIFGESFAFTDSAHVGRARDDIRDVDFKARSFTSFWDVALETANSRFYGGIHTSQDNEVGLEEGRRIANHVNQLEWRK
ncbi:MAG: vanadium-dependent haloperoxidase [Cyclobacteriaceae bacterium]